MGTGDSRLETPQTSMSTLEMALSRPEASLVTGQSYALHCSIEHAGDLPIINGDSKDRFFTVSAIIEGHKDKTKNLECSLCDDQGRIPITDAVSDEWHTSLVVPFELASIRKMPLVQLRLSHVRPHFKQEVGRASVALSTIPIYQNADQAEEGVATQLPADIYMHKPKMKRLPPGVKQRKLAHVCHLKVKLWLTKMEQVIQGDARDEDAELFGVGEIADIEDDIGDIPHDLPAGLEWVLVDEVVNAGVHKLNKLLFDENSNFMQTFTAAKGYTAVSISPWDDEGKRDVCYTCPKSALIKSYRATEKQEYTLKSSGGYVVCVRSLTPDAPYGNTFEVLVQFKLTPDIDKRRSHLEISAEMKWLSNPYMKRMVRNGAKDGLMSTYKLYVSELLKFINLRKASKYEADDVADTLSLGGRITSGVGVVDDSNVPQTVSAAWSSEFSLSRMFGMLQLFILAFISYQLWTLQASIRELLLLNGGNLECQNSGQLPSTLGAIGSP